MRFLSLDLRNYGPFERAPLLDLSGGHHGLHIVVGPNEAGKSTALRAIRSLLFDFPKTDPDAHDRSYDAIRVGASIERISDGNEHRLDFLRRRRGRKLWTLDDAEPLPDDALEPFLGDTDADTFKDLFSMDHAELVSGGKGIVQGKGRLGEMLFAAGSGMGRLDLVRRSLEDDMGSLFKSKNAVHPAINKTLKALKQVQEETRSETLPTSRWEQCDAARTRALDQLAQRSVDLRRVESEIELRNAQRKALAILPRRREILEKRGAIQGTILLAEDFSETFRRVSDEKRIAGQFAESARRSIERLLADLQASGPPDPILGELKSIARLVGDYNAIREDVALVPLEISEVEKLEQEAETLARRLPEPVLCLRPVDLASIREQVIRMGQQSVALRTRSEAIERSLIELSSVVSNLDGEAGGADGQDPDRSRRMSEMLDIAVSRALSLGDLEKQLEQAESALISARNEAEVSLRSLALWNGTLEQLETLAAPPAESFSVYDEAFRRLDGEIRELQGRRRLIVQRLELIDRELMDSVRARPIPSQAHLDEVRESRDRSWNVIRGCWVDRQPSPSDPTALADDYEERSRDADDLSDRLRREADRVAAHAAGLREKIAATNEISTLDTEVELRRAECDRLSADWVSLWRRIGIEPLTPREMKDWNNVDRDKRLQHARGVRKQAEGLERLRDQIRAARRELSSAIVRAGEPELADGESLAAAIDRARLASLRQLQRQDWLRARANRSQWVADQAQWDRRWVDLIRPIGFPDRESINPDEAMILLSRVEEWMTVGDQVRRKRDFIETCRQKQLRFVEAVDAIRHRLEGVPIHVQSAEPIEDRTRSRFAEVERLLLRAEDAQQVQTRREEWMARIRDLKNDLEQQSVKMALAGQALEALAREADCAIESIPEAIRNSDELRLLTRDLRQLDDQLDLIAGPSGRLSLLESVEGLDPSTLADEFEVLSKRRTSIDLEMAQLNREVGSTTLELSQMENHPGAIGSNQEYHNVLARLGGDVQRLTRLRLASAILHRAVERYREIHQGQILELASIYFERMTGGSFSGLKAEIDDKGLPTLRVLRRGETSSSGIEILSDGTADQLYFALRLASLGRWLDDHEAMPLVIDDILINFDDERASAALQILAEMSSKTQILFFTHHHHLCSIARDLEVHPKTIFLHDLLNGHPTIPPGPKGQTPKSRRNKPLADKTP